MPIYTRTGDKGKTTLLGWRRVSKADPRVDVYGTIDELNSLMGVVFSEIRNPKSEIRKELKNIQKDLLEIGSTLANPQGVALRNLRNLRNLKKRIKKFEDSIDKMTAQMPKLNNFILPGGGRLGAILHLARAVCRRAERKTVEFDSKKNIDKNILIYLNRLSDLLFTMARFSNFKEKKKEIIWPAYAKASAGERKK